MARRPANARPPAVDRFRNSRRSITTPGALTGHDRVICVSKTGFTSHVPQIVYCYRQLLALDPLDQCSDLGVAGRVNSNVRRSGKKTSDDIGTSTIFGCAKLVGLGKHQLLLGHRDDHDPRLVGKHDVTRIHLNQTKHHRLVD
jgi:hypothetical protein